MKLFQHLILMRPLRSLLVKCHDVHHHLGVLPARILGNAALVDESLPFFRQALNNSRHRQRWAETDGTCTDVDHDSAANSSQGVTHRELPGRAVVADMGYVNGVLRRGNDGLLLRSDQRAHETRETGLFSQDARPFWLLALVGVA